MSFDGKIGPGQHHQPLSPRESFVASIVKSLSFKIQCFLAKHFGSETDRNTVPGLAHTYTTIHKLGKEVTAVANQVDSYIRNLTNPQESQSVIPQRLRELEQEKEALTGKQERLEAKLKTVGTHTVERNSITSQLESIQQNLITVIGRIDSLKARAARTNDPKEGIRHMRSQLEEQKRFLQNKSEEIRHHDAPTAKSIIAAEIGLIEQQLARLAQAERRIDDNTKKA